MASPRLAFSLLAAVFAVSAPPSARAQAAPGQIGQVFDFRKDGLLPDDRAMLAFLGYAVLDDDGSVTAADGSPLTVSQWAHMRAPYDLEADKTRDPIHSAMRVRLTVLGFRFDEENRRVLSPESKGILSRFELAYLRKQIVLGDRAAMLGRFQLELADADPSKPLSPEKLARLSAMMEGGGGALPANLHALLARAGGLKASGPLKDAVDDALLEAAKFFDGQTTLEDLKMNALPRTDPKVKVPGGKAYFDQAERSLGALLQGDLAAVFSANPVGRELLDKFRGKDGTLDLPAVLVLRLGDDAEAKGFNQAAAVFNPYSKSIIMNYSRAKAYLLNGTPPAERAALEKTLSGPQAMNRHLYRNPADRRRLIEANQVLLFHEATHAWQDRRLGLNVEVLRGNAQGADNLEYEYEAYMNQNRYFHSLLTADPKKAVRNPEIHGYYKMITDFDQWRSEIARTYLETLPAEAAAFPTVKALQKQNESLATRLMDGTAGSAIRQGLRLLGLEQGSKAIAEAEKDLNKRLGDFRANEYPKMSMDGLEKISSGMIASGRPAQALVAAKTLAGLRPGAPSQAVYDDAAAKTYAWLKTGPASSSWSDIAYALNELPGYYAAADKPLPADYYRMLPSAYAAVAEGAIDAALAAPSKEHQEAYLESAGSYIDAVHDEGVRARLDKKLGEARRKLGLATTRSTGP